MMGRTADQSVAAVWRRRVARQRHSGVPVAEFCRQEGVSSASFYAWRTRLRKSAQAGSRPLFVPVEVSAAATSPGGVQIELPGGAVVTLPAEASAALLTMAIRAAMSAAASEERSSC